jgi:ribosomal protein S18 acetylase RimI-like enzyme
MADLPPGFRIRLATVQDHPALKDICLKTGDAGQDATALQDDPELLGLVYAVPYQVFAPGFAFLLEDAAGPCGYVLGVPDTRAFQTWLDTVWYPPLRARLRNPGPDEAAWQHSDWVRWRVFAPVGVAPVDLTLYPAHGHIDLLPRAQGRGLGAALMDRLTAALEQAGSPGMFLEVAPANLRAQVFYARIGFHLLSESSDSAVMGKRLGVLAG